jgi:hypothetical protein
MPDAVEEETKFDRWVAEKFGQKGTDLVMAAAAVLVFSAGLGLVGSGSRLYKPEVVESDEGNDAITKVNTDEVKESEYDEEEVCQEIEEKLGAVPVRFSYRPQSMYLTEYLLKKDEKEAVLNYMINDKCFYVYISKDSGKSGINSRVDGEECASLLVESCGINVKVLEFQDSQEQTYYSVAFEYLNTYYSFIGVIGKEEFIEILENIWIKNI